MGMSCSFNSSKQILWMSENEASNIIKRDIKEIVEENNGDMSNVDIFQNELNNIKLTEAIYSYVNSFSYHDMWDVCKDWGDYRGSFEGNKCDDVRDAFEEFLQKEINFENITLSKECLEYTIEYISKKENIRLGLFRSKEHMLDILNQLLYVVNNGGEVTFICSY